MQNADFRIEKHQAWGMLLHNTNIAIAKKIRDSFHQSHTKWCTPSPCRGVVRWGNKHEYWMWSSSDLLGVYNRACSFFLPSLIRFWNTFECDSYLDFVSIPLFLFSYCNFELNESGTKRILCRFFLVQLRSNFKQTIESNKQHKHTHREKRKKVKEKNKTSSCLFIFSKNFALPRRLWRSLLARLRTEEHSATSNVRISLERMNKEHHDNNDYNTTTNSNQRKEKQSKANQTETYTLRLS